MLSATQMMVLHCFRLQPRACLVRPYLARAVVPPPRLRAKWVAFSAPLRTTLGGSGWALAWRCGEVESLRNPAPRGDFSERSGGFAVEVEGGDFKKSNFGNHL